MSVNNRGRINSLQIVRAISFLGIYVYHVTRTFTGHGKIYEFFLSGPGQWGVSSFFVLSGFLMTYSYWDRLSVRHLKDAFLFAVRKIKRLYPLHIVMLFPGALYAVIQHQRITEIIRGLIVTIPLMQTWSPYDYQAINTVAWYLSVCLFLYFIFPYLLPLVKNGDSLISNVVKIIAVYLVLLLVGYCSHRFTSLDVKWITYCHPVYRTGDFAIGCFLASIYRNTASKGGKQLSTLPATLLEIAAVASCIITCKVYADISENLQWFAYTCLFIPSAVLFVYSFSLDAGFLSGLLKNRIIFWIADISPYAFLIHRLVLYYVCLVVIHLLHTDQINMLIATIIPFALTVAAVYLYLAVEKKVKSFALNKK